jgi:hypothetical protein
MTGTGALGVNILLGCGHLPAFSLNLIDNPSGNAT